MAAEDTTELLDATGADAEERVRRPDREPRARTRWAGIVWGLVLLGCASGGLRLVWERQAAESWQSWLFGLELSTAIAYGLLAVGAIVLVCSLIGLLRRAQRARRRRALPADPASS